MCQVDSANTHFRQVMMMAVTAAMALYDDLQRQRADYEINTSEAKKIRKGEAEADLHDLTVSHEDRCGFLSARSF